MADVRSSGATHTTGGNVSADHGQVAALLGEPSPQRSTATPVIFFDGVCGLCNRFVDFVLTHDRGGLFLLAPLQGETARARLSGGDVDKLHSVVLLDDEGTHRQSTAVVRILQRLGGIWFALALILRVVPRPLRDAGYSLVARYRYMVFGKKDACRMPTAAERGRFLP